jgi:hypothetical protein
MAKRLIQRAHTRDGLPEIAIGLTFLFCGALNYAQALVPRGSAGFRAAVVVLSLLIPVLLGGAPQAVKWVRRRYLIERVGYVESKRIGRRGMGMVIGLAAVVAAVVSLAAFGVVTRFAQPDRWLLAGTGLLGGGLAALCGQIPRFVVGGVVMAVAGILIAFSGVSLLMGFAMLFGFTGLLALVSGGVVFFRFMRQPAEPGE